jgi:hypothetical protein
LPILFDPKQLKRCLEERCPQIWVEFKINP